MDQLRWILLAAGALLVAGIYVWGLRARRRSAAPEHERAGRVEPARTVTLVAEEPRAEPRLDSQDDAAEPVQPPVPETRDRPAVRRPAGPVRREPRLEADGEADSGAAPAAARSEPRSEPRIEPRIEPRSEPRIETGRETAEATKREPPAASGRGAAPRAAAQKIVALRLVAPPGEQFEGARLLETLGASGFAFGRYQIFHRLDPAGRPLVSLASLREPGTFDPQRMPELSFRGVVLFAVIPGPLPAGRAFDELIATSRDLAAKLGAQLQDEHGGPLSVQRIGQLRSEVADYERARGMASGA